MEKGNIVTLALAPCTYEAGMVIVKMSWKPICTRSMSDQSAAEIWEAAERMKRDYDGNFNANSGAMASSQIINTPPVAAAMSVSVSAMSWIAVRAVPMNRGRAGIHSKD